jgi:hypothetical protein
VVASFGVTADISAAEFLISSENRVKLVGLVQHLTANHPHTNFDEAAKLVELLSLQLQSVYGSRSADLSVRVYSDLISAPSIGKPQFSLADHLVNRLAAHHPVVADSLPDEQRIRVDLSPPPANDQARKAAGGGARRPVPTWALPLGVGGGLLALGVALLFWFWVRSRRRPPCDGGLESLLVTENTLQVDAEAPEVLVRDRRVPVAPGVPAVFSTDPNAATYIASVVPEAPNGELFRVEPLPDGSVRIQSQYPRLTVNDEPLAVDRRLKVSIREPIRVRLGPREFNIIGVFGRPQALGRADDVFDAEALQH